jgi:hypothetical protein
MSSVKRARGFSAVALALGALGFAALVTTGCGGSGALPGAPSGSPAPVVTAAPASGEPPAQETPQPGASGVPGQSYPPEGSLAPEETPSADESPPAAETLPAEETPEPAPAEGVAACTGTVNNRTFFETIASQVHWDVYCAVLPAHWNVDTGDFSLRDGGRMQITYKGPGGARLTLQQGVFCTEGVSACSPRDQTLGEAAFGDRMGTLVTLGPDMGFAIYVDAGQAPSWALTGSGLDQATFVALAAALHRIELTPP